MHNFFCNSSKDNQTYTNKFAKNLSKHLIRKIKIPCHEEKGDVFTYVCFYILIKLFKLLLFKIFLYHN